MFFAGTKSIYKLVQTAVGGVSKAPTKLRDEINRKISLLSRFPLMYPEMDSGEFAGLRRIPLGRRSIYYIYWSPENVVYIEFVGFPAEPRSDL